MSALLLLGCGGATSSHDTTAPTITSSSSVSVDENAMLAHGLTASESVTWSIVGGDDAGEFEISGSTLRWTSNGTQDYEAPADADADSVYLVTVRATDIALNTTDQAISVTVDDLSETTARQLMLPGGSFINTTADREFMAPDGEFANET